jgi:hypothetical protein
LGRLCWPPRSGYRARCKLAHRSATDCAVESRNGPEGAIERLNTEPSSLTTRNSQAPPAPGATSAKLLSAAPERTTSPVSKVASTAVTSVESIRPYTKAGSSFQRVLLPYSTGPARWGLRIADESTTSHPEPRERAVQANDVAEASPWRLTFIRGRAYCVPDRDTTSVVLAGRIYAKIIGDPAVASATDGTSHARL